LALATFINKQSTAMMVQPTSTLKPHRNARGGASGGGGKGGTSGRRGRCNRWSGIRELEVEVKERKQKEEQLMLQDI